MVTHGDVILVCGAHPRSRSTRPAAPVQPAGDAGQEPEAAQKPGAAQAPWWFGPLPENITVHSGEPWTYTPVPGHAYEFGTGRPVPLPEWAGG